MTNEDDDKNSKHTAIKYLENNSQYFVFRYSFRQSFSLQCMRILRFRPTCSSQRN